MSKIYSFIIALCLFVSSAVVAEAAEWVYLTSHNSLNGDERAEDCRIIFK